MNIFNFIKSNLPIVDVIQEYTTLRPAGVYWKGLCPFHSEKTSSFTVSPHKDIFYCFGCHMGGDVIAFIAKIENISQIESAKFLIDRYHIKVPEDILNPAEFEKVSPDIKDRYLKICALVAEWCHENLKKNRDVLAYLTSRNISKNAIEKFKIGYFPPKSELKNLIKHISRDNILAQDLVESGIISENRAELYSGFEDRIMFPISTPSGDFCGFGGRVFRQGDDRAKYYNSKENSNFNKGSLLYGFDIAKKSIQKQNSVFLVEGYLDCITMVQAGLENTVASLGTACTAEHLKLISRFAEKIYVLYDGDDAGQKAMLRLTELAWNVNLEIRVLSLPKNEDPASYLRENGDLGNILKNDQSIYSFFINSTKKDFLSLPLSEKLSAVKKLTLIINKIEDPIKQSILLQQISREFSIPIDAIKNDVLKKQVLYNDGALVEREAQRDSRKDSINLPEIEMQIIGAVLHEKDLLKTKFGLILELLSPGCQNILKKLKDGDDFGIIIEDLDLAQQDLAIKSYICFKEKQINAQDLINQFQKSNWKRMVSLIKDRISDAEAMRDFQKMDELLNQFKVLKEKFISGGIDG